MMNPRSIYIKNKEKISVPSEAVVRYNNSQGALASEAIQSSGKAVKKVIDLAKQNQIELQEDDTLLNTLISIDLGESVPPQLYAAIAQILLLLDELERSY